MEFYNPPCESSEILNFNLNLEFKNLLKYLNFLDSFNQNTLQNLNEINYKIKKIDDFEREIKDVFFTIESFKSKVKGLEDTIYNHHTKILNIEANSKDQTRILEDINSSFDKVNRKIENIDFNITTLNKMLEDNNNNIEMIDTKLTKLEDLNNKQTITLNKHQDDINYLNGDVEIMKNFETKLKEKFKRQKDNVKFKLNDIDSLIESLGKKQENLINLTKKNGSNKNIPLVINQSNEAYQGKQENNFEVTSFMDKTKRTLLNFEEDIRSLKKVISGNKSLNSKKNDKDSTIELKYDILFKELRDKIKLVHELSISKLNREDLEKSHRSLLMEIDKLNQKINKIHQANENPVIHVPHYYEEHKNLIKQMQDLINKNQKENEETFSKFYSENETKNIEITKLYESIIDLRRQMTEASNDSKVVDLKELPLKLIDIEGSIKNLKMLFENLSGADILDSDGKDEQPMTLKEFVKSVISNNKVMTERLEKVNIKLDGINSDVLFKIKKDLMSESTSILKDFRSDLKSNLLKIEDQMRDKVDKLNMDELIRKFDQKIISEVSRKLDRNDLKKNNNVINRKIDTLENKISRTLVDTLLDLQLEEAPLIIKQGIKGEKCASCNQNIAHSHHNEMASTNSFKKMVFNTEKIKKEDNLLKSCSSTFNFHPVPEIPNIVSNNNLNTLINKNRKTMSIDKVMPSKNKRNFNKIITDSLTVQYYDGDTDKNFNNMINDELEKFVIKPDNIMRANNKAYEKIEKKK